MSRRTQFAFLLLVLAQAAHSIEEYATGLYDVFGPARFASRLVSQDGSVGFAVLNIILMALGLWCWAVSVRSNWPVARALVWF